MTKLLELLVSGVSLGVIYTLIAVGFVIVYRSTEVVNFAQGTVLVTGGYLVARFAPSVGFFAATLISVVLTAALAALIQLVLLTPLRRRNARHDAAAIMTIGVNILLTTDLTRRIGADMVDLGDPWGKATVSVGPAVVPEARVAALISAVVILSALLSVLRLTPAGLAMRAAAEDGPTAALCGVRTTRVALAAWAIAGALATVAAIFLSASPTPGLNVGTAQVALAAFPAVVIGGLDSLGGAVIGGLVIGLVQALVNGYGAPLSFLGSNFGSLVPWLVMVAVLLVRPAGLFGVKAVSRV